MAFKFFDSASTTRCCDAATRVLRQFSDEDYGNPSSSHAMGEKASQAIRDARQFFARYFQVQPDQVIFTGSGSESDNLAVCGVAMAAMAEPKHRPTDPAPMRVIASCIEHPAVKSAVESLKAFGFDVQFVKVDQDGKINEQMLDEMLTPATLLVSIMTVNNIVGSVQDIEGLAKKVKAKVPHAIFHTDAVQAFGKVDIPRAPSAVDLVSISGHKVYGPKGIGALIALNPTLMKTGRLRPLIWGGGQEGGWRSGTQNAGLIGGFHAAAAHMIENRQHFQEHTARLRDHFKKSLESRGLLTSDAKSPLHWNSPADAVPHIVSLSLPGMPTGPLSKLLEERGCLVSTGSACSSKKAAPDHVLECMGKDSCDTQSGLRVSFCSSNTLEEVDCLVTALDDSIQRVHQLLSGNL
ncbi:MAG: cysteine desulfurase family protein [Bacteriovoracia bacterium]